MQKPSLKCTCGRQKRSRWQCCLKCMHRKIADFRKVHGLERLHFNPQPKAEPKGGE